MEVRLYSKILLMFLIIGLTLVIYLMIPSSIRFRPEVKFSKFRVDPGEFFVVSVISENLDDEICLTGEFLLESPKFYRNGKGVMALVPVHYRTQPGTYLTRVEIFRQGRQVCQIEQEIMVPYREFPIQRLYVSQELQGKRDEKLWAQDGERISKARTVSYSQPLWEGSFIIPLEGRWTTGFGEIRFINDVDSGRHSGIDIGAPSGTPVIASNHGIVVLAQNLYVTGNTVVVDHGLNLFRSYCHLHRIYVQENQEVSKGEVLGTVGNTGFSTGPHLHWTVTIGSAFVDPMFSVNSFHLD